MIITFILYVERKYFLHKKFYYKIHYLSIYLSIDLSIYNGVDKSLVRPGRKQATATENVDISYLLS